VFCCFSFLIVSTLNVALCVCAPRGLSIGVFHNCLLMFLLPLPTCVPLDVCWCSSMFLLGSVHYYLLTLLVIRIVTIANISYQVFTPPLLVLLFIIAWQCYLCCYHVRYFPSTQVRCR
jgi:hypothetical protein